jgi:predicted nucleic acid-binding protein
MDLLIASVAVTHNATLVTNNLQHFTVIEGLRVEDWLE